MAIFKRNPLPAVLDQLSEKGAVLQISAEDKQSAADSLIRQAGELKSQSQTDASHSVAVVKALDILHEAGVSI